MKYKVLWFVIVFLFVSLIVLSVGAQGEASEKPYEGVLLRFVGNNMPWTRYIMSSVSEFEEQTGMEVEIEEYGEDQLNQKLTTEFVAGRSDIDVFMSRPLQAASIFQQNNWVVDLNKFAKEDEEYDLDDFSQRALNNVTRNGVLTGIPIISDSNFLYYRKDVFEEAGLKPPDTMEEMMEVAKVLTNPDKEMYGYVGRGQRSALVTMFSPFLYGFGGDFLDVETGTATFDTPEALRAIDFYGTILREYGPPGVLNMSWQQCLTVFAQGKAAMYTGGGSQFPGLLDPEKSIVADKTGILRFPKGPVNSNNMYFVTTWDMGIYSGSENIEAAWEFVRWATSKEMIVRTQGEAIVPSGRKSAWANPEGIKAVPADFVKAFIASTEGIDHDRPQVTAAPAARDIVGAAIVVAIEGGDYITAAKQANIELQELIDKEK